MYIKTLTIQGFKSYRDQTAVEPFSPGHNVVVGRNGSGKSNFFSAIRFVLSDAYTSMSREERQALLHDSSSSTSTTLSAFVEIVFDNSDNRFPTNGDEVILRRTIGLKKDEYSIDRKSASKADVGNLLESAGFSRSNPYYIVPQGRITNLTNAKDHERLGLLKEVAGTRVYEQRRAESLKIMEETDAKRAKIDDLLLYIEERLRELDSEKEELREYYTKDKERRCLEYSIYQRELGDVAEVLEKLEDERRREVDTSNAKRGEFNDRERVLAKLETDLSSTRQEAEERNLEKLQLEQERRDLTKARTQVELLVRDLEEAGERSTGQRGALDTELERLHTEITQKESELMSVAPEWEDAVKAQEQARERLEQTKARIATLYSKQGRSTQFRTQAERDTFLKRQIAELKSFETSQRSRITETQQEKARIQTKLQEVDKSSESIIERLEGRKEAMASLSDEWSQLKERRDGLLEQKKDLWKEETKLASSTNYARDQLSAAQRNLASTMDKATASGIQAVERISRSLNLEGVHGPLYQLFTVDDKYKTAVEVTASNSLYHIVVDNDETASKILEVMNKERTGRVTFMPLNRLKNKAANFPAANDAILMIKKLQFDKSHTAAFEQVFGRTIICPNLEIASAYVRSHGLNAITLDGDKVERKGALTGGYHDPRRSRLDAIKAVKKWKAELDADSSRLAEVKKTLTQVEQEITSLVGNMQQIEAKRTQAQNSRVPLTDELTWIRREEEDCKSRLGRLERLEADQNIELNASTTKRSAFEQELKVPMTQGLSDAEVAELDVLNGRSDTQKTELAELTQKATELANRKNMLEIDLEENLRRRRDELTTKVESLGEGLVGSSNADDLAARKRELKSLKRQSTELEARAKEVDEEIDELSQRRQDLQASFEKTRGQQAEDGRSIARQQKSVERYLSKRQRLLEQRDKCNKNIRNLGVLPEEAFEKYTNTKSDKLLKSLHKVNEALKKYSHVNKKAVEQYNNFTKQRDQLMQRQEELQNSASSIQELIEVLDQRKDEAIERTFKQVSKYFEEVFEKLVPAGRGRLIMQKRIDQPEDEVDEDEGQEQSTIENYTGVSIKVSFNSKVDEGLRIQQLSGGQKSLVALATVFAIQKCDPAPFYLFDEIDANLDAQYRTAVAAMIHELSSTAQFITTTFRPEMVAVAEQHYGVLFNAQKISSIRSISKDEANEFVEVAADGAQR